MKRDPTPLRRAALLLAAAALPLAPLAAQDTQPPADAPVDQTPTPTPVPTPTQPVEPATDPVTPTATTTQIPESEDAGTVAPAPAATRAAPRAAPRSAPARTIRVTTPAPSIVAAPVAPPATGALPAPDPNLAVGATEILPEPQPLPETAGAPPPAATEQGGVGSILPWILGALALGALALLLLRRRRRRDDVYHDEVYEEAHEPLPVAHVDPVDEAPVVAPSVLPVAGAPIAAAPAAVAAMSDGDSASLDRGDGYARYGEDADSPDEGDRHAAATAAVGAAALGGVALGTAGAATAETGRPRLDLLMKPVRAGVTGDEARVEFELAVTNHGDAAARDVRVSTWMVAAGASSEMERALIEHPEPETLPDTTIEAGAGRRIEAEVTLPTAQVKGDAVLPVVVAEARYRLPDGSEGRTSASFAVGVPDGEELAHFAIDNPSGLHDEVVARALGEPEHA